MVKAANLQDFFGEKLENKTVFAPTNAAFGNLANETMGLFQDPDFLVETLKHHVVEGKVMSTDLQCNTQTKMAVGSTATLCGTNGKIYQVGSGINQGVNSFPQITATDIETCYGVVHTVDQLLIPA